MLQATCGVNTHKGALFSFALAIAAASEMQDIRRMQHTIARIARELPEPQGTHGSAVTQRYSIKGAMQTAREGFPEVFNSYLDAYRDSGRDVLHTLMHIMSTLDDTNVYHRAEAEGAEYVKAAARRWLENPELSLLAKINDDFIARNISPGGAADMLALTLFIDNLSNKTNIIN